MPLTVNTLQAAPLTDIDTIDLGLADMSVSEVDDIGYDLFSIITGGIGTGGDGIADILVSESTEDGGANVITFVLTSGKRIPVTIRNGNQGKPGQDAQLPPSLAAVHIGPEPPTDPSYIWVDTSGAALPNQEGELSDLRRNMAEMRNQLDRLMRIVNYGIIGGDSTVSANSIIASQHTPIDPATGLPIDLNTIDPSLLSTPNSPLSTPTVPHLVLKKDTRENFLLNSKNLIEGEIIIVSDINDGKPGICSWLNGRLYKFSTVSADGGNTGGGDDNPETPPTDDMTQEQIEALFFNRLGLLGPDNKQYAVSINDEGNLVVFPSANYDTDFASADALIGKLVITEAFLGGEGTKIDSCAAATHNFVEIANLTTADINLNGLFLCYYNPRTVQWHTLPLQGVARANTTFLVRGAECAAPSNDNLHVDEYDMLWHTDGAPIEFSALGGSIYLAYSQLNDDGVRCLYNPATSAWVPVADFAPTTLFTTTKPAGYIDLFGVQIQPNVFSEGSSPVKIAESERIQDCVFFRFNGQDVTSSTIVAYASRKTSTIWSYCNMTRTATDDYPYFTDDLKQKLTPRSTRSHKTFYGTRTTFSPLHANYLNCTFGKRATAATGSGADRCFTWVSVGYHDEYLQYRPVPTADFGSITPAWHQLQSITTQNVATAYNNDLAIATFIKIYARKRWVTSDGTAVTTHRVILRDLAPGTYEYRVVRPSDLTYGSDTLQFVVKSDADATTFTMVQTSDQQGFTFMEYQAWAKSCYAIAQNHTPDFTINTGDMTQSGNRESEWLDYYAGRRFLKNVVEMPTVGNNDLGPVDTYNFRTQSKNKVSAKYFQYLYTFDLDPDNSAYFRYVSDSEINDALVRDVISFSGNSFTYYMPSMYSFDFGEYHFICLNSEFYTLADDTSMGVYSLYYNDKTIAATLKTSAYWQQYKWMVADVAKAQAAGKKIVVYCHEIPFCITAYDADKNTNAERTQKPASYSELNTDFTDGITHAGDPANDAYTGGFAYSEFFQQNGIHLCLGGHKHTYSLSYPVKERVSGSGAARVVDSNNPIVDKTNYLTATDGVVYLMSQATGYKLSSNNDKPCTESPWLYKWFPFNVSTGKVSTGQQYPMYNVISFGYTSARINSYYVDGVWYHESASKATAFDINRQYDPVSVPIDGVSDFPVFY